MKGFPQLIIIDGVDRTGKTSLINYINKQTNYKPLIMDRGPIGYMAYCEIYKKKVKPSDYWFLERGLTYVPHLCVYLYANVKTIKQRFKDTNEPPLVGGIRKHLEIYNKYAKDSKLRVIKFNTTYTTTKQIYNQICEYLK